VLLESFRDSHLDILSFFEVAMQECTFYIDNLAFPTCHYHQRHHYLDCYLISDWGGDVMAAVVYIIDLLIFSCIESFALKVPLAFFFMAQEVDVIILAALGMSLIKTVPKMMFDHAVMLFIHCSLPIFDIFCCHCLFKFHHMQLLS
jgi:hypothetical protein